MKYTENRQVQVRTAKDSYRAQQALYQLLQSLPDYFLQISQSEIINSRQSRIGAKTGNGCYRNRRRFQLQYAFARIA